MKEINVAILGCGTVGGGVAKILLESAEKLKKLNKIDIKLKKIVELFPNAAKERFGIPLNLFCGEGKELTKEEANEYINKIIKSKDIDLVVETIGGTSEYLYKIMCEILKSKKFLVTANKAMLAERPELFNIAEENKVFIGYEAAVCGAIPVIKVVKESFSSDEIISLAGIMNGTTNYILTKMKNENLSFKEALKIAQKKGYAESDPTLDINGTDAAHKLAILAKIVYGIEINFTNLSRKGIDSIEKDDLDFAEELDSVIKLICFAEKKENKIFIEVTPMMVKKDNILSKIEGSTNAILFKNRYSDTHVLIGKGAGSLETASSIISDIIFIAKYIKDNHNEIIHKETNNVNNYEIYDLTHYEFPYCIIFTTEDRPGITGLITTAIGNNNINIDTVSHNRHGKEKALFSIAVMPCTFAQIKNSIQEIKEKKKDILLKEPKIIPILY